ncbi:MAG: IS256 family transposase, partial [Eggerthellaceae bacterium]|nr:IS256 family transposase [Eggerthellaceae bacterium]
MKSRFMLHAKTVESATAWLQAFNDWCGRWEGFLAERTLNEETGKMGWTHERLVTARNGLITLIKRGHLFTFLDPALTADGPLPSTNNKLEGGVNAQLRDMLRKHRGLSLMRRAKAVFWWCYMHTECPLGAAGILAT